MDAMTPRAIKCVSDKHGLEWAGKSISEISALAQVKPGVSWNVWYKAHSAARAAVFVRPEVFADVAREAVIDADLEGLKTRVMRFSLSMPEYCFKSEHGRKPKLGDREERMEFLTYLDQIIGHISIGLSGSSEVNVPLVFSISSQDSFIPIIEEVADIVLSHKKAIAGIDITNEQVHRLATEYREVVEKIRNSGIEKLTVHTGENESIGDSDEKGRKLYKAGDRILAALGLKPDTIGHAIYAVKYPVVINAIGDSGVVVELCPSSNLYLNQRYVDEVLKGDEQMYPILRFIGSGIPCTINSDTPGSIGSSLQNEFDIVREIFGLPLMDLIKLDNAAQQAARRIYGV